MIFLLPPDLPLSNEELSSLLRHSPSPRLSVLTPSCTEYVSAKFLSGILRKIERPAPKPIVWKRRLLNETSQSKNIGTPFAIYLSQLTVLLQLRYRNIVARRCSFLKHLPLYHSLFNSWVSRKCRGVFKVKSNFIGRFRSVHAVSEAIDENHEISIK